MSNSKVLLQELVNSIHVPDDKEEVQSIAYLILEHEFKLSRIDVMTAKEVSVNKDSLSQIIERVNHHEPIQYILGEADFFERKFIVNPSVLIPRPETELLISEVLKLNLPSSAKILDLGTGSGCIAITLTLEINANVIATDISAAALSTARQNASALKADVLFMKHDILTEELILNDLDLIVSNPPYISTEEKKAMERNVLDYEPYLALFSERDPLLFYKNIAAKAKKALNKTGKVVVEINEHFGKETMDVFKETGFLHCELIKDLQNKDRVIIAQ